MAVFYSRHYIDKLYINPMETSQLLLHQEIKSLIPQDAELVVDAAIYHWELMANQIISIVGEGGFNALYIRCAYITRTTFPWLAANLSSPQVEGRFASLRTSLEGQTPEQAGAANALLLITFSDILTSLIGEELTTRILRSAWAKDAPSRSSEEFKHE